METHFSLTALRRTVCKAYGFPSRYLTKSRGGA